MEEKTGPCFCPWTDEGGVLPFTGKAFGRSAPRRAYKRAKGAYSDTEVRRVSVARRKKQAILADKQLRKQKSRRAGRPALSMLGLPEDAVGSAVRVTLLGERQALVENHRGMLEIGQTRMRVLTRQGVLSVYGSGLALSEVRPEGLMIEGQIERVELPGAAEGGGWA